MYLYNVLQVQRETETITVFTNLTYGHIESVTSGLAQGLFHSVRPKTCTMSRYFADLKMRMRRARRITRRKEAPGKKLPTDISSHQGRMATRSMMASPCRAKC